MGNLNFNFCVIRWSDELDGALVVQRQDCGRGGRIVVGGSEGTEAGFEAVHEGGGAVDGGALGEDEFSLLAKCCSEDHDGWMFCIFRDYSCQGKGKGGNVF